MAGPRVICSTGVFTRTPDRTAVEHVLDGAERVDADAFELIFYGDWLGHAQQVAEQINEHGLAIPVLHASKSVAVPFGAPHPAERAKGLAEMEVNCELARALGAELVVLHLWELPHSDRHFDRNLGLLPACLDIAEAHGVGLAVETIPGTNGPLTNLRRALDTDPRCLASLDTEFLAMHGEMEEALASDWLWDSGRVRHIHIKDYDGRPKADDGWRRYLHPGEGDIDFDSLFDLLVDREYDGFISLEACAQAGPSRRSTGT